MNTNFAVTFISQWILIHMPKYHFIHCEYKMFLGGETKVVQIANKFIFKIYFVLNILNEYDLSVKISVVKYSREYTDIYYPYDKTSVSCGMTNLISKLPETAGKWLVQTSRKVKAASKRDSFG